ncbi:MAG: transcriptional regulator [Verrucomicrobia bacterium CG_4_10_14_3_um_filter_43_23]|nr:MAG: transcriptional regulator [Verrucomicrobia bacterium CG22_combo_CG10-13_8_21_14_all_43_17]PIX58145.1 MAG: transcriptional regulator [Verrucomicrobia bacterium CG_4_10_14_3_um_filter_43_23]PIY61856.1 MAG: transcriptional regulator [Verrucomicrobia bacterium CG_4_10_14_0_8_um_filter_43_34]PJA44477.1 MAG: transcriptional regulator [Verrucomicrobia bacterium CG_4_9_14_3_um_filter_43_20]
MHTTHPHLVNQIKDKPKKMLAHPEHAVLMHPASKSPINLFTTKEDTEYQNREATIEKSSHDKLTKRLHTKGALRLTELTDMGLHPEQIRRLCASGEIMKLSRGLYMATDYDFTIHHSLVEVTALAPHAVICLLSALSFHDLTTQLPNHIYIGIPQRTRPPKIDTLSLRVFRFSEPALQNGIETHIIEGIPIKVTTPARTVVDCFKYRNKIGISIALEALIDALRKNKATLDEISHFAKLCKMHNIIKPYLKTIAWIHSEH